MKNSWKKWGAIIGSSLIATTAFILSPFLPVIAPIIMIASVIGGATYATIIELKEEYEASNVKTDREEEKEEKAEQYQTIEEAFHTLLKYTESFQMDEIQKEMENVYNIAKNISDATEHLDEEEVFFVYNVLFKDVYQLLHSYSLFTQEEKEEKSGEMIEIISQVKEKMDDIYVKIKKRKDKKFEASKIFIQEKLKRY